MFGINKRGGGNDGKPPLEDLVNQAVSGGIGAITDKHPRYSPEFLAKYLDPTKLNQYASQLTREFDKYIAQGMSPNELRDRAYKKLAKRVASGEFFTEQGKRLILRQGLEKQTGRPWFGRGRAKEILEGEKYLDSAMKYFRDIYDLMRTGEYAQRMPELTKAISAIYDLGFFDTTANILYENGQLNSDRYEVLKDKIKDKARKNVEQTKNIMDQYLSQTLAATILSLVGVGILFASNSITGNVIGTTNTTNIPAIIFGALSLIFGIYFIIRIK